MTSRSDLARLGSREYFITHETTFHGMPLCVHTFTHSGTPIKPSAANLEGESRVASIQTRVLSTTLIST